jgi:hypothetical protein
MMDKCEKTTRKEQQRQINRFSQDNSLLLSRGIQLILVGVSLVFSVTARKLTNYAL